MDGTDVSDVIRLPHITKLSSPVSAISAVRRYMVARQRELAGNGGVVMEGRDIGSVVLPNAEVKVFLTASAEERARRRHCEMLERGIKVDVHDLKREIEERDNRDSTRRDSPLLKAAGAVEIDTDKLSIAQVVDRILALCEERGNGKEAGSGC